MQASRKRYIRQSVSQANRQVGREAVLKAFRHTGIQVGRQTYMYIQVGRDTRSQWIRHTGKPINRYTGIHIGRPSYKQTFTIQASIHAGRQASRQRCRQANRQAGR